MTGPCPVPPPPPVPRGRGGCLKLRKRAQRGRRAPRDTVGVVHGGLTWMEGQKPHWGSIGRRRCRRALLLDPHLPEHWEDGGPSGHVGLSISTSRMRTLLAFCTPQCVGHGVQAPQHSTSTMQQHQQQQQRRLTTTTTTTTIISTCCAWGLRTTPRMTPCTRSYHPPTDRVLLPDESACLARFGGGVGVGVCLWVATCLHVGS